MSAASKRGWTVFGLCVAALVGALGWVSAELLDLEGKETRARAEARYQENLRLALWRLDSRMSQLLAREAARPHDVYMPFYLLGQKAYTRNMAQIEKNEILAQSPLTSFKPDYVRLHFQIDAEGRLSSPQVPSGVFLEVCDLPAETVRENERILARLDGLMDDAELDTELRRAERKPEPVKAQKRWQVVEDAKQPEGGASPSVGTLEPLWRGTELLFVRRADVDGRRFFQGFLADWSRMRELLLAEIEDLFPEATLTPATDDVSDRRLFTVPVVLGAPKPALAAQPWTASHTVLLVTWVVVAVAVLAVGLALRKSVRFGESQRRFASLVTHELRSPLTTFRLYSELLAEDLVKEKEKRAEYHRTLQKESDHMARMVENVIAHARIEEGRAKLAPTRVLLDGLLDGVRADLEQCCARAGLGLAIEADGLDDVALSTDAAAVGQILFNLVENACKYGRSDFDPAIRVAASVREGTLRLSVRDYGPGVPPAVARSIFAPFERGARDEADPTRGLGLGLALSRGLARDLGGDLSLAPPADGGACFVLTLPVVR